MVSCSFFSAKEAGVGEARREMEMREQEEREEKREEGKLS